MKKLIVILLGSLFLAFPCSSARARANNSPIGATNLSVEVIAVAAISTLAVEAFGACLLKTGLPVNGSDYPVPGPGVIKILYFPISVIKQDVRYSHQQRQNMRVKAVRYNNLTPAEDAAAAQQTFFGK